VVTAVVFGPLVAGVSLASAPEVKISNSGTLTIANVTFPSEATIEPASYGAANHYVSVPPATVQFEELEGTPTLIYTLKIPTLGKQISSAHLLTTDHGPTYDATVATTVLNDSALSQSRYDGELSIAVRNGTGQRTVASKNVTVRVVK
jgi:hypothetical protein